MSNSNTPEPVSWRLFERAIPFIGLKFYRLTVLRIIGGTKRRGAIAQCRCDCGQLKVVNLGGIRNGDVKSCGCLLREMLLLPTTERISMGRKRTFEHASKRISQEKWKSKNKDKVAATAKRFRERHEVKIRALKAAYYQRTKKRIYAKIKARSATDIAFKIESSIRSRIRKVLKRQDAMRSSKIPTLLGCSLSEFKSHIASKFTDGMTWDKFLSGEIHIDHNTPCRAFNLADPMEQAKCFHYTNHIPLWKLDNLRKSDFLPDGTRARLITHHPTPLPI